MPPAAGLTHMKVNGQLRLRNAFDVLGEDLFFERLAGARVFFDARNLLHECAPTLLASVFRDREEKLCWYVAMRYSFDLA